MISIRCYYLVCHIPSINEIKNLLKKNIFSQGAVTIDFADQTFVVGFARGNRLTGVLRHFDEKNALVNVTEAETGNNWSFYSLPDIYCSAC